VTGAAAWPEKKVGFVAERAAVGEVWLTFFFYGWMY
jgi:hypothetical protein